MNEGFDRALELWREGTARLLAGELEEAIALFTRSLETHPTAEAYTFRGWAYSFAGRLDEAIVECHKAIATGDKTKAEAQLRASQSVIDSVAAKGVFHRNAADRYKSRLSAAIKAMG